MRAAKKDAMKRTNASQSAQLRRTGVIRSRLKQRRKAPKQGSEGAPDVWLDVRPFAAKALSGLAVADEIIILTWQILRLRKLRTPLISGTDRVLARHSFRTIYLVWFRLPRFAISVSRNLHLSDIVRPFFAGIYENIVILPVLRNRRRVPSRSAGVIRSVTQVQTNSPLKKQSSDRPRR